MTLVAHWMLCRGGAELPAECLGNDEVLLESRDS